jgi:hypothetical protein
MRVIFVAVTGPSKSLRLKWILTEALSLREFVELTIRDLIETVELGGLASVTRPTSFRELTVGLLVRVTPTVRRPSFKISGRPVAKLISNSRSEVPEALRPRAGFKAA